MLSKIKLFLIFIFTAYLCADSLKYNFLNKNGVVGLIKTPTARFLDESSAGFGASYGKPDSKVYLLLAPYEWLETSIYYTSIEGREYSNFDQDYKDKGFNLKFRIKDEGNWPAIAIGINDIGGTGIYSSEYVVGSYGLGALDMHLGVGWGILSGGNFAQNNFLKHFSDSFEERNASVEQGGTLNIDNLFSGEDIGIFGGLSYLYNQNILLIYEYDSTDLSTRTGFYERKSGHNFGLQILNFQDYSLGLTYENQDYFGIKVEWKNNSKNYSPNKYKKTNSFSKNKYTQLRYELYQNDISVSKVSKSNEQLKLEVFENSYTSFWKLQSNVNKAVDESGIIEEVLVSYASNGLVGKSNIIENKKDKIIFTRINKSYSNLAPKIVIRPFIAGRESFIKAAIMAELNAFYVFSPNFSWTTNIKYPLYQNFNDLYLPPENTYPNQVRSDIKDYLNNFGNRLLLGRSQFDFFKTITNDHHIQLSLGIFEEMFAGYGIEYLWRNNEFPIAIGFEAFKAYKRGYDLRFDLQEYSNITGHLNLYYENKYLFDFDMHLSFGEYLAGDKGYTLSFSRNFPNGVSMGAYFTRTDVTFEQFGEGSFDKGIFFSIPLDGGWYSFNWRPLTKDPGSKLIRMNSIYGSLRKYTQ